MAGRGVGFWWFVLPAGLCWALTRLSPALVIDDAYITFRYAENLARGAGLVFNPGERVLGTSAPLWALLLASARKLGAEIPAAAVVGGQIGTAGACGLLSWLVGRQAWPGLALAAGVALALHPDTVFFANSGMETGLYLFLVQASLGAAVERRFVLSGALGTLGALTRPDGVLLLAVAGLAALVHGSRFAWLRFGGLSAAVLVPWLIFAALYYGSPLPQSIAAKQVMHGASFSFAWHGYLRLMLPPLWPMWLLALLALPGLAAVLLRRDRLWPFGLWAILYAGGLLSSGIGAVFAWYVTPLLPLLCLFAAESWSRLSRAVSRRCGPALRAAVNGLGLIVLVGLSAWLFSHRDFYRQVHEAQFGRVRDYLQIGEWLNPQARPGDKILVGEVGALGFALMDFTVLDSSGINSPEIHRLHLADREKRAALGETPESAAWVKETLRLFRPQWIVTWYRFLHLEELALDPDFRRNYVRVLPPGRREQFFVLKRRETP